METFALKKSGFLFGILFVILATRRISSFHSR